MEWDGLCMLYFGEHLNSNLEDFRPQDDWCRGAIMPKLEYEIHIINAAQNRTYAHRP